jgi:hypothetical protein
MDYENREKKFVARLITGARMVKLREEIRSSEKNEEESQNAKQN